MGIDTARGYSGWIPGEKHRSERIVGDWLKAAGVFFRTSTEFLDQI